MFAQVAVLFAVVATLANATLYTSDPTEQKKLWEEFKTQFGKKYETMTEESHRFSVFIENLRSADLRNIQEKRAGGSAVHGTTQFSDLSQAEFEAVFLTYDPTEKPAAMEVVDNLPAVDTTAALVDWSGKLTTPVKDQGYCGSCWAFSATEQIESDAMRTLGVTYTLSAEQITQCAPKPCMGCNGGFTENAYTYVKGVKGLVTESNYPYTSYQGKTGTCNVDTSKAVVGVTGYTTIKGESNMASYVQKTGPLSVCLDASSWNSYKKGIMTTCGKSVDHCVQAVGVDASSSGYWKVRNSWGTSWGESGYIRLAYGKNTCAISNDPTYATVKKA